MVNSPKDLCCFTETVCCPFSDPNMSKLSDSLLKKGASIRRSLRFNSKKDNNKAGRQDLPVTETETTGEKEIEEEQMLEEIEELYMLPEIPHTPLSGKHSCIILNASQSCFGVLFCKSSSHR